MDRNPSSSFQYPAISLPSGERNSVGVVWTRGFHGLYQNVFKALSHVKSSSTRVSVIRLKSGICLDKKMEVRNPGIVGAGKDRVE